MTPIEAVERALLVANARLAQMPTYGLYQSIHAQLTYLRNVLTGLETDRARLRDLDFGVLAVRELDDSDPAFAEVLHPAYWVAMQLARGIDVSDVPP